jgi:hypothetical protein
MSAELRTLIRRMSIENKLWGAPHIHGELLKLGFVVAESTVAKYMAKPGDGRFGSELGHVPAQSSTAHCRHGFVRFPDHDICPALRSDH